MIGALLWCPRMNKYLLLKRSSQRDVGGGQWECVTGRLDQGEGYSEALLREINEELGVETQVEFIIGTTHFYRGEQRVENEMVGVHYCCSIDDPETISLSAEHSECRWVRVEEAHALLTETHWLRALIDRAEILRSLMPTKLVDYHRANGFEV